MPAMMKPLIYLPFLAVVVVAAAWLLASRMLKSSGQRIERKIAKMLAKGRWKEAVNFLASKGEFAHAARLVDEKGDFERAADLLVEGGDYLAAAKAAAKAEQVDRAAELFQRGGDLTSAAGCYMTTGRMEEAILLFRQKGELATCARMLEHRGEYTKALAVYMEAGNLEQVSAIALERIDQKSLLEGAADYLQEHGQKRDCVPLYKKAGAFKKLATVAEELNLLEEAVAAYEHDYFADAGRVYAKLGEHRNSARAFLKGGKLEQALEQLILAGDHLAAARIHRRMGRAARCLEVLDTIPRNSSQYRDGTLLASSILEEHQRIPEAVERLDRLLEVLGFKADSQEILYRKVDLLIHTGDHKGAVRALEQAKRSGLDTPSLDEQLMLLRASPQEQLTLPDQSGARQAPPVVRSTSGGSTTTIGFPHSERYSLKRKLARGGHGVLFLVSDNKLGRDVVLKLLHSESLPSALAKRYFMREAKTASSLKHANIVQVYDYGELQGRPYISMEFVDGMNLLEMQEPPARVLSLEQKLAICLQLCDALGYAHSKTIIHRDIKMENIMVTRKWQVKLMDFGLAKALDENPDRSLMIVGTPYYMSPEQIVGDTLDPRTDIYSMGVLMYRLFTERLPFEDGEVLSSHRFATPPDPREFRSDLPPLIASTILKCLEKDRQHRFQSAADVAGSLKCFLM